MMKYQIKRTGTDPFDIMCGDCPQHEIERWEDTTVEELRLVHQEQLEMDAATPEWIIEQMKAEDQWEPTAADFDEWLDQAVASGWVRTTSPVGKPCVFDTHGADTGLNCRSGQLVDVLRPLTEEETDLIETGPMYEVQFVDGTVTSVFEDELTLAEEIAVRVSSFANIPNEGVELARVHSATLTPAELMTAWRRVEKDGSSPSRVVHGVVKEAFKIHGHDFDGRWVLVPSNVARTVALLVGIELGKEVESA